MKHLAIIADGNRKWAKSLGYPTVLGYNQGLITIEKCCQWALDNSLECCTIFCFSTENWKRPQHEIDYLMDLGIEYIVEHLYWYVNKDIKIQFIGRTDRLKADIINKCRYAEKETINCTKLLLNICLDYGGRDEIITAIQNNCTTEEEITSFVSHGAPPVDAILRTGGEYRLSNFLLWQSAYAELFFIPTYFPDLNETHLNTLLNDYNSRIRSYGA